MVPDGVECPRLEQDAPGRVECPRWWAPSAPPGGPDRTAGQVPHL